MFPGRLFGPPYHADVQCQETARNLDRSTSAGTNFMDRPCGLAESNLFLLKVFLDARQMQG
jgi:hypothetical protein